MKIGMSVRTMLPYIRHLDGIGHYTKGLSEAICEQNNEIVPYYIDFPHRVMRPILNVRIKKAIAKQYPSMKFGLFCPYFKFPHAYTKDIDIYHSTDFFCPRFKSDVPVIATIHDALIYKHPQWMKRQAKWAQKLLQRFLREAIQTVHHVIAVSHAMVDDIVNHWQVKEENITVIYPGIKPAWFESTTGAVRDRTLAQFNLTPGYLLFVGTLQPKKNLDRMITAFLRLPKALRKLHPLVIVGQSGWQTTSVLSKIKLLEHEKIGKWLKYVSFTELKVLYQNAAAILFPSLSEGFGFPILEGFASKTPVLTSNITAMPEIAQNAALLVDPYSIDAIYQGTLDLLTDDAMRQKYITQGLERVKVFSWDEAARQTCAVYKKFL